MANPPHLFRVDRRLDELVLHIRPWSDDVVDKLGFDPRSVIGLRRSGADVGRTWLMTMITQGGL